MSTVTQQTSKTSNAPSLVVDCKTLDEVVEASLAFDNFKADYISPSQSFKFDQGCNMVMPTESLGGFQVAPQPLKEKATRDLCAKLGPSVFGTGSAKSLPYDYLSQVDPDQRADLFNRHNAKGNPSSWMARTYDGNVRAVLSGSYPGGRSSDEKSLGYFDNTQYAAIVRDLSAGSASGSVTLVRPTVTPDNLILKVVLRNVNTDKGDYGIGYCIENDEIGQRKLRGSALIQRHACTNSIIRINDDNAVAMLHRGSFAAMRVALKAAIGRALGVAGQLLDKMIAADEIEVPDFDLVLDGLALKHRWSPETRAVAKVGAEGKETKAAVVNAVTFAAHSAPKMTATDRVDMEALGGDLLFASSTLFHDLAMAANRAKVG